VEEITKKLAEGGYPFQNMVFEIARSLPFQQRRAELSEKKPEQPKTAQPKAKEIAKR
jgi:hypothetical protein